MGKMIWVEKSDISKFHGSQVEYILDQKDYL